MNNRDTHRYIRTVLSESNQKLILKELKKSKHFKNIDRFNENILESRNRKILKEDVDKVVADLAVENNLPAESEPILRNHILTLMSAVPGFIPNPVAAYLVFSNAIKGNFVEAFKNLPIINTFLVPEALYEVTMAGLAALPASTREDIVQNRYVKELLRLLSSLKDLQKSEDVNQFYENLKRLISDSGHALVAFCSFLNSIAAFCVSYGVQITAGLEAIAAALLATPGAPAAPILAGIGAAFGAICGFFAGSKLLVMFIQTVANVDPNKFDMNDPKFKKNIGKITEEMSKRHREQLSKSNKKIEQAGGTATAGPTSPPEAAAPAPTQLALTDQSQVSNYIDTELGPDGVYAVISESKINLKLWHRIAGL